MYQFVLSKEVVPPFTLFWSHPQAPIQLSVLADQSIAGYENSLLLIIPETDKLDLDWLTCFEVTSYASCNKLHYKILYRSVNTAKSMLLVNL